ncbi:MAG: glycosyltransferase family 4 protein [Planctomycetota bacterium]|jgi:glycosyltransferase involved in cell wall biosynthesis
MNIMEIVSGVDVNGAIRHCLMLTRELVERGNRVTVVCRPEAWIAGQLASGPVEVIHSDLHRWPLDELRKIGALASKRRVDVVHTHMSRAHFFGVLLRWMSGLPCVATAQNRHVQLHWMFNDRVIACSEATRRYHRRYNFVPSGRIVTIHNFIDYRRMSSVPPDVRPRVRASWRVDESSSLIGAVGTICPRKGQIYLVRALPKVLEAAPGARLVLVGAPVDGPYTARLRAEADRLKVASKLLFAGHRDDVHEIMAALDVCVLASLEEPQGMVLLEAMAAGLPVVGTKVGGIPECVRSGQTGTLVAPADSDALAEAVAVLLRNPTLRRRYGQAGRKHVWERFSPQRQTSAIEAVYAQAASRRRAA